MKTAHYSFWLIPRIPNPFQPIIDELILHYETAPFFAHLTLCSQEVPDLFNVESFLTTIEQSTPPITLKVKELACEDTFSKTLFVRFHTHPRLQQLVDQIVASIPDAIAPTLDPHVSLLYHSITLEERVKLLSQHVMSQTEVTFHQVQAIAAPRVFETQADVAQLRCVAQHSLMHL